MGPLSALIAGGSMLGASALQGWFQQQLQEDAQNFEAEQNSLNRDFTANQNALSRDWSSSENQKNRDFQDYLRSTAYQTQVEDMKKAGLNPALMSGTTSLASSSGGSSIGAVSGTPSMSSSPVGPANTFGNALVKAITDIAFSKENRRDTQEAFNDYVDEASDAFQREVFSRR